MATFYKATKKQAPKTNKAIELNVERYNHDGDGVAYHNGKICFVQGALPTEQVRAKLVEDKAKLCKAQVIKVLQPHPQRITPACQHFDLCGGCHLQYIVPEQQLLFKQQAVSALFKRFSGLEALPWQPSLTSPSWQYRRAARVGVWYERKTNQFTVGFRQRNSKFLTAIERCAVMVQPFDTLFSAFSAILPSLSKGRSITHLEVLEADNINVVVIRHTQPLTAADRSKLLALGQANDWLMISEAEKGQLAALNDQPIPELSYTHQQYDTTLNFRVGDFIQVNGAINQQMLAQAEQWLDLQAQDKLLDLFCGIGNFSVPLATRCQSVVGIEGVDAMVQQANHNAVANGQSNCQFFQADLTADFSKNKPAWLSSKYDKILLDPARAGAEHIMPSLAKLTAKKIVYVSCDPLTLARDSAILIKSGYQLRKIALMDMFSHTRHVEVMALFTAQK